MSTDVRKILLTGGTGLLGRRLRMLDSTLIAPSRSELDVSSRDSVMRAFEMHRPAIVIHAAAMTSSHEVNAKREEALAANVAGTANVAMGALRFGVRLVYISTDYVYTDSPGPHREDEPVMAANNYTWTKLGGECAVRLVSDALIIRTSFGARPCPYDRAAENKITSKVYVDEIAPFILELALSAETGVINVGGSPRSMYDYARESRPDVKAVRLEDLREPIPRDTSLDLSRWRAFRRTRGAS